MNIYNKNWKIQPVDASPLQLINGQKIIPTPWFRSMPSTESFDFISNREEINRKLQRTKKEWPITQPVRVRYVLPSAAIGIKPTQPLA